MLVTRTLSLLSCALLITACGTYSRMRAADPLRAGQVEVAAGLAASTLPEVVPVVSAAVGLTDWLELEAIYEVYTAFGELRAAPLTTARDGIALSIGAGAGVASVWVDAYQHTAAVLGDVVVGRRFGDHFELYLGHKVIVTVPDGYVLNATRLGARGSWKVLLLGVEGGVTVHHSFATLGEGTVYGGLRF